MYKNIFVVFAASLLNFGVFAQSGTYQCIHFEKINDKSPEDNVVSVETKLLEVDFDDQIDPHVSWLMDGETNDPAEVTKSWNIKTKISTVQEANPQRLTTTYTASKVVNGVEEADLFYIYKTEDRNMQTLTIVIHSPKDGVKYSFMDMIKR